MLCNGFVVVSNWSSRFPLFTLIFFQEQCIANLFTFSVLCCFLYYYSPLSFGHRDTVQNVNLHSAQFVTKRCPLPIQSLYQYFFHFSFYLFSRWKLGFESLRDLWLINYLQYIELLVKIITKEYFLLSFMKHWKLLLPSITLASSLLRERYGKSIMQCFKWHSISC